jgi:hypothetical protein
MFHGFCWYNVLQDPGYRYFSNCNDPVTAVNVVVQPPASVEIEATNPVVCIGGISVINSTITNGSGVYLYQWQSSPEGSSWSNIKPESLSFI